MPVKAGITMERLTDLLRGCVTLKAGGAFPAGLLNRLARGGVVFWNVVPEDPFTLTLTIRTRDVKRAQEIAKRCQCTLAAARGRGAPAALRRLRRRVMLVLGLILCLAFLFWSSLYIWDIEVVGNENVSTEEILIALQEEGVGVGSFWPPFSGEDIRSRVLLRLPELSWITVNVRGSRAEVIVRERIPKPAIIPEKEACDILAAKSGIISEMRVLRGETLVKPGQTVLEGETLVSGLVSSSFAPPRLAHAMAEVKARTWYEFTAAASLKQEKKLSSDTEKTRFALVILGRRINFYAGSGIPEPKCDKIIMKWQLAKEGVFTLPVSFVRETLRPFYTVSVSRDPQAVQTELETALAERLNAEIGDGGEIRETAFTVSRDGDLLTVTLRAECVERIDRMVAHSAYSEDTAD
jgi:similar to stage IV sporulation protein